ncbi:MAG TPA: DUF2059 domain-containing protein [Terracidiphilus sp.]|nr:DUF2059 domain-containing protein [Terracidiphilus sp.]
MKTSRMLIAAAALVLTSGASGIIAQAYSVGTDGKLNQEQTAPAIPPEDQPSAQQLARLFEVMQVRRQVQNVQKSIADLAEGQIHAQIEATNAQSPSRSRLTPSQRATIDQLLQKYIEKAVSLYPVDEMLNDMTPIYQRHFTREDVDAIIAFYSSPAGQHMIAAQPQIAREYMPLVMNRAAERSRALNDQLKKDLMGLVQSSGSASSQPSHK